MILLLAGVLFFAACGPSKEQQAQAILDKARELERLDRMPAAMREYDRLVEFKGTEIYQETEAALLKRGISIGSAETSWTIKEMYRIKNQIIREQRQEHPHGEITVPLEVKDTWGMPYFLHYSRGDKYYFLIKSAGPDKVFATDDDLKVIHQVGPGERRQRSGPKPQSVASPQHDAPGPAGRADAGTSETPVRPSASGSPPGRTPGPKANSPGEVLVDLEELMRKK